MLTALADLVDLFTGPMGRAIGLGGLGLALVVLALLFLLRRPTEPFDRLRQSLEDDHGTAETTLRRGSERQPERRFTRLLQSQSGEQVPEARKMLLQAGYRSRNALRSYQLVKILFGLLGLGLGLIYAVLAQHQGSDEGMRQLSVKVLLAGVCGYYLPVYLLRRKLEARQMQITLGFPDALDMMLVCVEAGQSLDQALVRVAREMRHACPPLAEEFETVAQQIGAGGAREDVLRAMSARIGLLDVTSFVTTLIQSATFGTSIADALRVYSSEMRDKRAMRAEERANTLPTKLTLGTMLFTVPPLLIMLIGPSIYSLSNMN